MKRKSVVEVLSKICRISNRISLTNKNTTSKMNLRKSVRTNCTGVVAPVDAAATTVVDDRYPRLNNVDKTICSQRSVLNDLFSTICSQRSFVKWIQAAEVYSDFLEPAILKSPARSRILSFLMLHRDRPLASCHGSYLADGSAYFSWRMWRIR